MDLIDEKALFLLPVKRLAGPPSDGHTERNLFGNTVPVLQSIYAPFTHTYANTFTHISSGFLVIFRHVVYKYFIRLFFQMNHKWTSILSRVKKLFGPRSTLPVLVSFTPLCAVCTVSFFHVHSCACLLCVSSTRVRVTVRHFPFLLEKMFKTLFIHKPTFGMREGKTKEYEK